MTENAERRAQELRAELETELAPHLRAARVLPLLWQPRAAWARWWAMYALTGEAGRYPGEPKVSEKEKSVRELVRLLAQPRYDLDRALAKITVIGTPKP